MANGNEVRRENRGHGNAGAASTPHAALNDSLIIVPIDDGTHGHYCLVPLPALDPNDPALKTALAVGLKYDAIRAGQAEAKKAAKVTGATPATISAALAAWSNGLQAGSQWRPGRYYRLKASGNCRAHAQGAVGKDGKIHFARGGQ